LAGKEALRVSLEEPKALAVDKQGNIFVVDSLNKRIQKFDANGKFRGPGGA